MRDPTCQLAFGVAGGLLQFIGAFFAGVGLWRAYQRLDRRPQFLINAWDALKAVGRGAYRFYRRRIENPVREWLGKKPRRKVVHASAASSTVTAGSARASVSRYGKASRRHDRELEKLRRDLLDLERRHEDLRNQFAEQGKELRRELREEAAERERRDEQVRDYARDLLAGVLELEVVAAVAIFAGLAVANFLPLLIC